MNTNSHESFWRRLLKLAGKKMGQGKQANSLAVVDSTKGGSQFAQDAKNPFTPVGDSEAIFIGAQAGPIHKPSLMQFFKKRRSFRIPTSEWHRFIHARSSKSPISNQQSPIQ